MTGGGLRTLASVGRRCLALGDPSLSLWAPNTSRRHARYASAALASVSPSVSLQPHDQTVSLASDDRVGRNAEEEGHAEPSTSSDTWKQRHAKRHPSQRRRAARAESGFNTVAERPAADAIRLRALFSRPSTSRSPAQIHITTLLRTIGPIFERDRLALDAFLHDIASLLSPRVAGSTLSAPSDAEAQLINDILAHCWTRSNELKKNRFTSAQLTDIGRFYARRLVRSALAAVDSSLLLTQLESAMRQYRQSVYLLPAPIYAAWAVLRSETKQQRIPDDLRFVPSPKEAVLKALRDLLGNADETFEQYAEAVRELLLANRTGSRSQVPEDAAELDSVLAALRLAQDPEQTHEAVEMWKTFKERLAVERGQGAYPEHSGVRAKNLASFLRFFLRSSVTRKLSKEEAELDKYRQEVLSYIPRPYPPAIHHALLSHRSRTEDEIGSGSEVRLLDESAPFIRDRAEALSSLEEVWRAAGEDDARDVKSYMLYMEGLAKLGEAQRLGRTWEALVRDEACRETYLEAEGSGQTFPPTRMLNHMISCALLVPQEGTDIALDLFDQVLRPNSAIKPNIVTINTVLRHYARRGNVASMTALFPLAEKLGLAPDVATYTVLLQGLLRAGELGLAANTLETMLSEGIAPNERTIALLISDLAKDGDRRGLRAAEDLMKRMRVLKMRITEVPWTSLISGYFRGGWDRDAWTAIERMEENDVRFNRIGYNMVFRELGVRNPPYDTWGWRKHKDDTPFPSPLLDIFKRMIKDGVSPNSDTYLLALTPLVRAHKWDEAEYIVKDMHQRGFVAEKQALRAVLNRVKLRKERWD